MQPQWIGTGATVPSTRNIALVAETTHRKITIIVIVVGGQTIRIAGRQQQIFVRFILIGRITEIGSVMVLFIACGRFQRNFNQSKFCFATVVFALLCVMTRLACKLRQIESILPKEKNKEIGKQLTFSRIRCILCALIASTTFATATAAAANTFP